MKIFFVNIEQYKLDENILKNIKTDRKFSCTKAQTQHRYGRFLVEQVAKNIYNIENSELEIINKKPTFKFSNINFSISHSDNIVIIAFDNNPVGIDIEIMKERNFAEIFSRYNYKGTDISKQTFYKFWTEYEACIKLQTSAHKKINFPLLENFMVSIAGNFENNFELFELCEKGFIPHDYTTLS